MFAGFSDKNVCHYSKRTQTCYLLSKRPGCYHSTIKINMRDFSDLSDSLNSLNLLNSMKVLLHSGKTPMLIFLFLFGRLDIQWRFP